MERQMNLKTLAHFFFFLEFHGMSHLLPNDNEARETGTFSSSFLPLLHTSENSGSNKLFSLSVIKKIYIMYAVAALRYC